MCLLSKIKEEIYTKEALVAVYSSQRSRGDISTSREGCFRLVVSALSSNPADCEAQGLHWASPPHSNYNSQESPRPGECARASAAEGPNPTDRAVEVGTPLSVEPGNSLGGRHGHTGWCWSPRGRLSP